MEKYGDSIMHTFFKTLFRFLLFFKGLYYLLNDNSILNSHTIRAKVNNLSLILKIAKFLTLCNKHGSRLACKAIRRKLMYRSLSNFAFMLQRTRYRCNDRYDVRKFLTRELFIIYEVLRNFQELRTTM